MGKKWKREEGWSVGLKKFWHPGVFQCALRLHSTWCVAFCLHRNVTTAARFEQHCLGPHSKTVTTRPPWQMVSSPMQYIQLTIILGKVHFLSCLVPVDLSVWLLGLLCFIRAWKSTDVKSVWNFLVMEFVLQFGHKYHSYHCHGLCNWLHY